MYGHFQYAKKYGIWITHKYHSTCHRCINSYSQCDPRVYVTLNEQNEFARLIDDYLGRYFGIMK